MRLSERRDEIVACLEAGRTMPEISRLLDIDRVSLFKFLKKNQLLVKSATKDLSAEEEAFLVEQIKLGLSNSQLAEKFDCGLTLVKRIKRKYGLLLSAEQLAAQRSFGGRKGWEIRTQRGTARDGRNSPEVIARRAATRRLNEARSLGFCSPEVKYSLWAQALGGFITGPVVGSFEDITWHCSKGHQWLATPHNVLVNGSWCPRCSVTGPSSGELEVLAYVQTLASTAATSRTAIAPMHLDVYVESERFGIEFNGLLFHSFFHNEKMAGRHLRKAELCRSAGIKLLAIFEDEWRSKQDLVKAMIRWRLGKFNGTNLDARKLDLRRLEKNKEFEPFFDRNHLDGHTLASYAWGLFYGDRLVCCASFRTNVNGEFELARLATDYDYNVRGGTGRLLAQVQGKLVSFSNNRLSIGDVYKKLGFELVGETQGYQYTDLKTRLSRWKCQRINDPAILAKNPEVPHTEKDQALAGMFSEAIFGDRRPLWKIEDYGHRKWVRG